MFKSIANIPTLLSIRRVIKHSHRSPAQFYQGLVYRTVERCLEVLPMCVCFAWIYSVQNKQPLLGIRWQDTIFDMGKDSLVSQDILFCSLLLLSLFTLQLCFAYLGQKQSFLGSYSIIHSYRESLIAQVRLLPLGSLYQYRPGQLAEMLTQDIKRIESIFTHIAADVFSASVAPVIWLIALLWLDWKLSLSLIAGLPMALLILISTRRIFSHVSLRKQELSRDTAGLLAEFALGIKTLRLFNQTDLWVTKIRNRFNQLKSLSIGMEIWGAGPVISYRLMLESSVIVMLLVMISSINNATTSTIDTTNFILFLLLAYKLLGPLLEVSEHLVMLRLAVQSENKIQTLFIADLLPEPTKPSMLQQFNICFDNVSFAYEQEQVLRNISFDVPQNTITAIVGPSGAGKSSIVNLVARFYESSLGRISIGDRDLACIGTEQLYDHISVVFQHVQLYDASVMENVRAGRQTASDEEVIAACKAANCDQFIRALSGGYHALIGEGGSRLSGGEQQRLSIARGLLKDAPILLLDEVTSSMDPQNQYLIQHALNTLAKNKTVIMIAHRLSTVIHADQILVMDKGKVVERGTHAALIQNNKLYKKLWEAQGR